MTMILSQLSITTTNLLENTLVPIKKMNVLLRQRGGRCSASLLIIPYPDVLITILDMFPQSVSRSIGLEIEKLFQYGSVTSHMPWPNGGTINLLPRAFTYSDRK